ncbi:MAG: hypothetical protein ACXQT0_03015 [Candidatus Methanofastidiosia archaeon]
MEDIEKLFKEHGWLAKVFGAMYEDLLNPLLKKELNGKVWGPYTGGSSKGCGKFFDYIIRDNAQNYFLAEAKCYPTGSAGKKHLRFNNGIAEKITNRLESGRYFVLSPQFLSPDAAERAKEELKKTGETPPNEFGYILLWWDVDLTGKDNDHFCLGKKRVRVLSIKHLIQKYGRDTQDYLNKIVRYQTVIGQLFAWLGFHDKSA